MIVNKEDQVSSLFQRTFGEEPDNLVKLPESGSSRTYFRISGKRRTTIGVCNSDRKENEAFLSFTRSFASLGLPVPEVIAEDAATNCYLLSDLGDETLFSALVSQRTEASGFPSGISDIYKRVLKILPLFQIRGGAAIDYRYCYPRLAFDKQSMLWDLNYFKYYFLKLANVPFDEQELEENFGTLTSFLLQADADHFMYRDFQSRNIMLLNNNPYFIDYQGGRKGPLQYDVASLLYDAKADLPQMVRDQLLECYLNEIEKYRPGISPDFLKYFPGFILIRILQALGAYGYRGYYEKKSHFLQSIPYALNNLRNLLKTNNLGVDLPALYGVLDQLIEAKAETRTGAKQSPAKPNLQTAITPSPALHQQWRGEPGIGHRIPGISSLTVTINSFSYKNGIPSDPTENGGGFVFDCRALPNPGRYEQYRHMTGKDHAVIEFLQKEADTRIFFKHVSSLVDQSVKRYIERGFQHLFVNFGCTGGQHRSVYFAERMKEYLAGRYKIKINLHHTNLP